ncbi:hypothetical protein QBC47DRAFT_216002 [Echria macrotheca]|uniref:Uncharacterized protein n=1 Tax=Echria macrotheca TaxID=438768 RepID=A0AAJ0B9T4_9PEZI|nr:hypothetical protein QBC47DRAFT_216002 [Echria macrotheca]
MSKRIDIGSLPLLRGVVVTDGVSASRCICIFFLVGMRSRFPIQVVIVGCLFPFWLHTGGRASGIGHAYTQFSCRACGEEGRYTCDEGDVVIVWVLRGGAIFSVSSGTSEGGRPRGWSFIVASADGQVASWNGIGNEAFNTVLGVTAAGRGEDMVAGARIWDEGELSEHRAWAHNTLGDSCASRGRERQGRETVQVIFCFRSEESFISLVIVFFIVITEPAWFSFGLGWAVEKGRVLARCGCVCVCKNSVLMMVGKKVLRI